MLAVVDDFVDAGMQVGACAAAEIAAALDQLHAQAGLGKGAGRAHAGHAAADDGDGFTRDLRTTQLTAFHGEGYGL